MAVARSGSGLFDPGQRSRAVVVRALCQPGVDRCDARAGASEGRRLCPALWRRGAAANRQGGGAALPGAWSLFVLVAGAPMVWRSIGELEAFPETYTSGYFIIKTSAWLLALLVLAQALLDIARRSEAR